MYVEWPRIPAQVVAWLRAEAPNDPPSHRVPLLALLGPRLGADEVARVAAELAARGGPVDRAEAAVAITRLTGQLPSETDIAAVVRRSHAEPPALLHTMCLRTRSVLATATIALVTADRRQAELAIDLFGEVAVLRAGAEREAVRALVGRHPGELRAAVAALRAGIHLWRMAALAAEIADAARRHAPAHLAPDGARPTLVRLGELGVAMAGADADVLATGDPGAGAALPGGYEAVRTLALELSSAAAPPELTVVVRCYEQFAEHAAALVRPAVLAVNGPAAG
ncbi:DUF3349 domain-containing protein [Nocardia sp. NPDC057353]|uniref:DUF3349 domain-containing protein n=1 Tax=Nocardia sp. NPDC057353 TaxID=3346104 RepID=UPI003639C2BE